MECENSRIEWKKMIRRFHGEGEEFNKWEEETSYELAEVKEECNELVKEECNELVKEESKEESKKKEKKKEKKNKKKEKKNKKKEK